MNSVKQFGKMLVLLMVFVLPISTAIGQEEQSSHTVLYYGTTMTLEELQIARGDIPFYCVQEVTQETVRTGVSNTFHCFDTEAESAAKYNEMLPAINQYFAAQHNGLSNNHQSSLAAGHWAVYAHVAYSGLIRDIYGSSDCVYNATIYSLRPWDGPSFSLEVRYGSNFTGSGLTYTAPSDAYWLTTPYRSARAYLAGACP